MLVTFCFLVSTWLTSCLFYTRPFAGSANGPKCWATPCNGYICYHDRTGWSASHSLQMPGLVHSDMCSLCIMIVMSWMYDTLGLSCGGRSRCRLVVRTQASHAWDRGFDPLHRYSFPFFQESHKRHIYQQSVDQKSTTVMDVLGSSRPSEIKRRKTLVLWEYFTRSNFKRKYFVAFHIPISRIWHARHFTVLGWSFITTHSASSAI